MFLKFGDVECFIRLRLQDVGRCSIKSRKIGRLENCERLRELIKLPLNVAYSLLTRKGQVVKKATERKLPTV